MKRDLTQIPAKQAAEEIRAGQLSSVALVRACLDRIMETDDTIQAWEFIDPDAALDRAQEMDWVRKSGRATGALHGVPVGLKDVVDTAGMKNRAWNSHLCRAHPICRCLYRRASAGVRGSHSGQDPHNGIGLCASHNDHETPGMHRVHRAGRPAARPLRLQRDRFHWRLARKRTDR